MKKVFFVLSVLLATQVANASNYYRCTHVGRVPGYTIEVDLERRKAAFFDNRSWTVLPLNSYGQLETFPPQMVWTFQKELVDFVQSMEITFNETRLNASVLVNASTRNARRLSTSDCWEVEQFELGDWIWRE